MQVSSIGETFNDDRLLKQQTTKSFDNERKSVHDAKLGTKILVL